MVGLAGLWPAAAAAQVQITQDGWQGFTLQGADGKFASCVLYNRTVDGINQSPYHMLGISRDLGGDVRLLVFFRPGALKRGPPVPVSIAFDDGTPLHLTGDVISDFHLRLEKPLTAAALATLRQAKRITASAQGQTETFALQDPGAVLDRLQSCVTSHAGH